MGKRKKKIPCSYHYNSIVEEFQTERVKGNIIFFPEFLSLECKKCVNLKISEVRETRNVVILGEAKIEQFAIAFFGWLLAVLIK